MDVTVNGERRETRDGISVAELLFELGMAGKPVAVEVNERVVKKASHAEHRLSPGDAVEVITFVGGG
ncbi:MAG: sulfur carrier protein ThiS [Planctomycetes bacterium]|nr:sulfur carrier protein ThiS [Planctomycetota bacterium]